MTSLLVPLMNLELNLGMRPDRRRLRGLRGKRLRGKRLRGKIGALVAIFPGQPSFGIVEPAAKVSLLFIRQHGNLLRGQRVSG